MVAESGWGEGVPPAIRNLILIKRNYILNFNALKNRSPVMD